jgi:hypothetical protein
MKRVAIRLGVFVAACSPAAAPPAATATTTTAGVSVVP